MNQASCHLKTDLSALRLAVNGACSDWFDILPMDMQEGQREPSAESLRRRAVRAADWTVSTLASRRRIHLVALDADNMQCLWLNTPAGDDAVLAAAVRNALQDWGASAPSGMVQRLDDDAPTPARPARLADLLTTPFRRRTVSHAVSGSVVLTCPASLVTLWLDALDARGIRCDAVLSIWHAMARAWGDEASGSDDHTRAVLLSEPGRRLTWCWARGRFLLVGGSASDAAAQRDEPTPSAPPADDRRAAARLSLDWLTWSAHLGTCPTDILIIGNGNEALSAALAERWPAASIRCEPADDPVLATLRRAAESAASADQDNGPRAHLVALSNRPTRSLRKQYYWAAAAIVMAAIALAGLGWRFNTAQTDMSRAIANAEEEARSLIASLNDPSLFESRNLVKALESKLTTLKAQPPPKLPPAPPPIHDELRRLADLIARHEGVRLVQLNLEAKGPNSLQLKVPDLRTGEEVKLNLQQNAGALFWGEGGVGADRQLRLTGNWIR